MNKTQLVVVLAYKKGYRVSDDGIYTNPKGERLAVKLRSNHSYPQSSLYDKGVIGSYHVHRLAAYCFYGEAMFQEGLVVRHLNADVLDISRSNIALGTPSQNQMDKPREQRVMSALKGVSKRQGTKRETLRRLTSEEVKEIKRRFANGEKCSEISKDYPVSYHAIYKIKRGVYYKDITI